MEIVANAVSAEFANNAKTVLLGVCLHGVSDISYGCPGLYCSQTALNSLIGNVDELFALGAHFSDAEHTRGVGVVSVQNG